MVLLKDIRSREPVDLPLGIPTRLRFDGVLLAESEGGPEVFLSGSVNLGKYHQLKFSGTNPTTGLPWTRDGIGYHAYLEDGVSVDKFFRAIGVRFNQQMTGDLETGDYLRIEYTITPVGDPPKTTYQVSRTPIQ